MKSGCFPNSFHEEKILFSIKFLPFFVMTLEKSRAASKYRNIDTIKPTKDTEYRRIFKINQVLAEYADFKCRIFSSVTTYGQVQ